MKTYLGVSSLMVLACFQGSSLKIVTITSNRLTLIKVGIWLSDPLSMSGLLKAKTMWLHPTSSHHIVLYEY
jgi:hypothetical protein